MKMKYSYWAAVILVLLNGGVAKAQDPPDVKMLENIVVTYMTAFNKGDFEEAVSLMHPEAIKDMSRMFMDAYARSISEGRESQFKDTVNIDKSLSELRRMEDRDVAVYLLRSNRIAAQQQTPMAARTIERVVVKATDSRKVNDRAYKVRFVTVLPEDNNSILTNGEFLIKKVNGTWRIHR